MKKIEAVSIWDNGKVQQAKLLNAYAVNVALGTSATFYYQMLSETEEGNVGMQLTQGNLTMSGEDYSQWEVDNFAWDWVAEKLNLVITGDYVAPVPPEPTPEPIPEPIVNDIIEEVIAEEVVEEIIAEE